MLYCIISYFFLLNLLLYKVSNLKMCVFEIVLVLINVFFVVMDVCFIVFYIIRRRENKKNFGFKIIII